MADIDTEVIAETVLYSSDTYSVFSGRQQDGSSIRIKTHKAIDVAPGESYEVHGKKVLYRDVRGKAWVQINALKCTRTRLSGALVGRWLERMPNVGSTRANRLLVHYGDSLGSILNNVTKIAEVASVLEPRKPVLANRISSQIFAAIAAKEASEVTALEELAFLTKLETVGVTDNRAARSLWRLVGGKGAIDRLMRNPYLAASLMDWAQADAIGKKLLASENSKIKPHAHPYRLLGAIDSAWRDILARGDTAASPDAFAAAIALKSVPADEAIALGLEKGTIKRSNDLYRAPGAAWLEDTLADKLKNLEIAASFIDGDKSGQIDAIVVAAQQHTGLILHDEQLLAVQMLLRLPIAVLQGGAGVGKTTVMKVLVSAWESLGGNVVMGALAGKAALQLSRGTSSATQTRTAYTVARLLRTIGSSNEFDPKKKGAIALNDRTLLILDEASMLDTPSLHQLLSYLPSGARLLLVGDEGQLPPVGIGRVFHDLVADGSRVVNLNTVRRQASDSPVPVAAALIRNGELPILEAWDNKSRGIFIVQDESKLLDLYTRILTLTDDVMVVAARRSTVDGFNQKASQQHRLTHNGDTKSIRLGPFASVAKGDHVVCTRNRYQDGLFNGLIGKVTQASVDGGVYVLWDGEDEHRQVTQEIGVDVELAYAITCHRAQGSSAACVIVIVEDSRLVTREWIYTAITRTRDTVILVGNAEHLSAAVQRQMTRITGFSAIARGYGTA